jgi:6-phosphogluconolactonase
MNHPPLPPLSTVPAKVLLKLTGALLAMLLFSSCGGGGSSTSSSSTGSTGGQSSSGQEVLYVGVNAGIQAFLINPATGTLTPGTAASAPSNITFFDMKGDPTGHFLYAAGSANGVRVYAISSPSGTLSEISGSPFNFPGAGNGGTLTLTPNGKFLFFADQSNIASFSVAASGALTLVGSPVPNSNQPLFMAVDPSGTFLYVADHADFNGEFSVYSISPTGALTEVAGSPFAVLANSQPYGLVLDPTGKFLFSPLSNAQKVAAMSINSSTGSLAPVAGSPFAAGSVPQPVALTPNGSFLYVGNTTSGTISEYRVSSGALTQTVQSPFFEGNPLSLSIDTSGKFLYVVDREIFGATVGRVSGFAIDSSVGTLASVGAPQQISGGSSPNSSTVVRLP